MQEVSIDLSLDSLLSKFSIDTLKDRYMIPGETSPQEVFRRAAIAISDNIDHARRLYYYVSNHWCMFSTPILSNAGSDRGLPISCYLSTVEDNRKAISDHWEENMFLASTGGGIGSDWSRLRSNGIGTSKGSKSNGIIPFLKVVDSEISAISQGGTRRGSYAAYLDISHPEIEEFINIRKATGGDVNRKCLGVGFHHAVNITDKFMEAVENNLMWDLIDPHTKKVIKSVSARKLWYLLLETRVATGEPYFHFIDEVNLQLPIELKNKGLSTRCSNLCSEIVVPSNETRTAICCLSSVNLEKYDEWKDDPLFIEDMIRALDNVITIFIDKAPKELWRAVNCAKKERPLGLGAMGFHSYLQKNNIPFESPIAKGINIKIFKHLKDRALEASTKLGKERGIPEDLEDRRNSFLLAIAPNASSSIICGNVSPSIEPYRANIYTQKTLSGSSSLKNKYLEKRLEELGLNTKETWKSINSNSGSVQHLDIPEWDKKVFKTAIEIDQQWIVEHAANRQPYICQSQSVNLFFLANTAKKYIHDVHIAAWRKRLKTLYYLRSESLQKVESLSTKVNKVDREECLGCSG